MSLRSFLLAAVAVVGAAVATPSAAHATSAYKLFTDRAAYLAAFQSPTVTQVDLNAETPGFVSTVGGSIGVSHSVFGAASSAGPTIVDPTTAGLPASYGTDQLLSLLLTRTGATAVDGGDLEFTLPTGVTGFAFTFGAEPLANEEDGELFLGISGDSPFEELWTTEPFGPAGGMKFLGIVVDPFAATDPTTSIASVELETIFGSSGSQLQLLIGDIEYTTSPVVSAVPEPATVALLATGLGVVLVAARRRRQG